MCHVQAAEAVGGPLILQAGPVCRAYIPITVLAEMFRVLADRATVPILAHLDHGQNPEVCSQAIEAGLSSVMYDGSALPLAENIANYSLVLQKSCQNGVSVEVELGVVDYVGETASVGISPQDAECFIAQAPVDALAISAGNTHLSQSDTIPANIDAIGAIQNVIDTPLVLHGGSGIPTAQRRQIDLETSVGKFNIGTELRQVFGQSLHATIADNHAEFDRNTNLKSLIEPISKATAPILNNLLVQD